MPKNSAIKDRFKSEINVSNCGSRFEPLYEEHYVNGVKDLILTGQENVYDIIQSFKDDNNIYKILDRLRNGDYRDIDSNQGYFFDDTKMPKSLNEYNDFMLESQRNFDKSDPKFKEYFKNDFNVMVNALQNGTFEKSYYDYLQNNHPEILKRRKDLQEKFANNVKEVVKNMKGDKIDE